MSRDLVSGTVSTLYKRMMGRPVFRFFLISRLLSVKVSHFFSSEGLLLVRCSTISPVPTMPNAVLEITTQDNRHLPPPEFHDFL